MQIIQCGLPAIPKYRRLQSIDQFPAELHSDNRKKISAMNECIRKCVKNKCLKSFDDYKRLPWTADILDRVLEFANKLPEHSPYKKEEIELEIHPKNC
jgi:hypothetical protein